SRLGAVTDSREIRRIALPTTTVTATAFEPIFNNDRVTELSGQTGGDLTQLMVQNQTCSNSFRDRDRHQIVDSTGVPAKPEFRQSARIGCIFQFDRQSGRTFKRRFQIEVNPTQIRSEQQPLSSEVNASRQTHADSLVGDFRMRFDQPPDTAAHFCDELFRLAWCWK